MRFDRRCDEGNCDKCDDTTQCRSPAIEYRGNSTPPERNMIAQRGVGISRGRLFKCRRLSSALCMPKLDEKRAPPYFYRLFAPGFGDCKHRVLDRPRGCRVISPIGTARPAELGFGSIPDACRCEFVHPSDAFMIRNRTLPESAVTRRS